MDGSEVKDLTSLLARFKDISGNIDPSKAPPDMTDLLHRLKGFQQQHQRHGADRAPAGSMANSPPVVTPKPGFVVKTQDISGQKVFVNICSSEHVLPPASWLKVRGQANLKEQIEEAVKGHQGIDNELLKFPMSMGDPRLDKDHSAELCTVLDVVYGTQVLELAQSSRPLKVFLVEVALACAVNAYELRLTELGTWKLPKMRYKGASIPSQKLHLQRKEPRVMEAEEPSSAGQMPHKTPAESNETAAAQPKQAASASAKSNASDEPMAIRHDGLKQSQHTMKHELISKQPVSSSKGHAATQPTANQPVQSQHATEQGPTSKKSQPVSGTKEHAQSKPSELPATSAAVSEPAVQADQQATSKKGAPLQPSQAAIQRARTLKETAKEPKADSKPLAHSVEFFGRPVESVRVSVDMGDDHDSSARSSSSATPTVVVKRDQVFVEIHGSPALQIDLPFGVDARQGKARLLDSEQKLVLDLPYKSYRSFTQDVCKKTPLINDFGFPDSYFMQLER